MNLNSFSIFFVIIALLAIIISFIGEYFFANEFCGMIIIFAALYIIGAIFGLISAVSFVNGCWQTGTILAILAVHCFIAQFISNH